MARIRNIDKTVSSGPTVELIYITERFIYDAPLNENEASHFQELNEELIKYALDSVSIEPNTALHKVLQYLAEIEFYLYLYDDTDWVVDYSDYSIYITNMFNNMNIPCPKEFYSHDEEELMNARNKYAQLFLSGLPYLVDSAFFYFWERKSILLRFNEKLAKIISSLKKIDYPELEQDGRLPRATYFKKWLLDVIVQRERGLCHHCGKPVVSPALSNQIYEIDHMVAIALGGTNDPTNLVLSCWECNNKKRAKSYIMSDKFAWPDRN